MKELREVDLAAYARTFRQKVGKTRAEAARDMGVRQTPIFHAEESPEKSYTKLRIRMIEAYSELRVRGPVFILEDKS